MSTVASPNTFEAENAHDLVGVMVLRTVKRRRRIEIAIETSQRFIIKRAATDGPVWCRECAGRLVNQEEAVIVAGITSRAIHRGVEARRVHFTETAEGLLLVCLDSLSTASDADDLWPDGG